MLPLVVRRLLLSVPTLAGVLVVVFLLLYVAPGDPVQAMVGERADAATIARLRTELKLDDPLPVQFAHYAGSILRGDLGRSYITNRPIVDDIAERFPRTLLLAGAAMVLATISGVTIGVVAAVRPNGWFDRLALASTYLGISFPVYWIGLLLILLFAVTLRWLPASGYGRIEFLILPALALGSRSIAYLARVTRSAMLEVMSADFVRTARAKGLSERATIVRHALRNALIPVVTVIGLDFGAYLTGSILTETIFSWPGIGRYVVMAISRRDLPAVQGTVLFLSLVFVLVNLATDVAYQKVDPRTRAT
jgi:ABC-type dipeptide/oligopeptide/nickel transport system permease component